MVKTILGIVCTVFGLTGFTQLELETVEPKSLAHKLVAGCSTDHQKVQAIFKWITGNIEYMVRPPRNRKTAPVKGTDTGYQSLDERVAISVLEKKVAICEGYARLFKTLCGYVGVRAEIIHGYARGGRTPSRFGSNHTWNAVLLDNEWKLLDLTWASGYVTWGGNMFVQELDEKYYLPSPGQFIMDHYPDDLRWSLMPDPPVLPEFRSSPFRQRSFVKYKLTRFSPSRGIIDASPGDIISIELETADALKDDQVGADPFLDTSIYNTTASIVLTPVAVIGNTFRYEYEVRSSHVQWLYILYNDDIVLRYRLQLKKDKADFRE